MSAKYGDVDFIVGAASSELVVDGILLSKRYSTGFKLIGVCFHHTISGDVQDDTDISKSGTYDLESRDIRILIPWNDRFKREFVNQLVTTAYELLAVPPGITPDKFSTIRQAVALGAKRVKGVSGPP